MWLQITSAVQNHACVLLCAIVCLWNKHRSHSNARPATKVSSMVGYYKPCGKTLTPLISPPIHMEKTTKVIIIYRLDESTVTSFLTLIIGKLFGTSRIP